MNSIFFFVTFTFAQYSVCLHFFAVQAKISRLQILPRIQPSRLPPYFNSVVLNGYLQHGCHLNISVDCILIVYFPVVDLYKIGQHNDKNFFSEI